MKNKISKADFVDNISEKVIVLALLSTLTYLFLNSSLAYKDIFFTALFYTTWIFFFISCIGIFKKLKKIKEPGVIGFTIIGTITGALIGIILLKLNIFDLSKGFKFHSTMLISLFISIVTGLQFEFKKIN